MGTHVNFGEFSKAKRVPLSQADESTTLQWTIQIKGTIQFVGVGKMSCKSQGRLPVRSKRTVRV